MDGREKPFDEVLIVLLLLLALANDAAELFFDLLAATVIGIPGEAIMKPIDAVMDVVFTWIFFSKAGFGASTVIQLLDDVLEVVGVPGRTICVVAGMVIENNPRLAKFAELATVTAATGGVGELAEAGEAVEGAAEAAGAATEGAELGAEAEAGAEVGAGAEGVGEGAEGEAGPSSEKKAQDEEMEKEMETKAQRSPEEEAEEEDFGPKERKGESESEQEDGGEKEEEDDEETKMLRRQADKRQKGWKTMDDITAPYKEEDEGKEEEEPESVSSSGG